MSLSLSNPLSDSGEQVRGKIVALYILLAAANIAAGPGR